MNESALTMHVYIGVIPYRTFFSENKRRTPAAFKCSTGLRGLNIHEKSICQMCLDDGEIEQLKSILHITQCEFRFSQFVETIHRLT